MVAPSETSGHFPCKFSSAERVISLPLVRFTLVLGESSHLNSSDMLLSLSSWHSVATKEEGVDDNSETFAVDTETSLDVYFPSCEKQDNGDVS